MLLFLSFTRLFVVRGILKHSIYYAIKIIAHFQNISILFQIARKISEKRKKDTYIERDTLNKYFHLVENFRVFGFCWSIFPFIKLHWAKQNVDFVNDFMCLWRPLINNILKIKYVDPQPDHHFIIQWSTSTESRQHDEQTHFSIHFFGPNWEKCSFRFPLL